MRTFAVAAAVCAALLAAAPRDALAQPAHTVHVAPAGDDAGPGTADRPLASLTAARDAVRRIIADTPNGDIRVQLHDGVYRIAEPLTLGPADSAPPGRTITWAAAPGASPVISGGRAITGWRANDDGTWSATLPELPGLASGDWRFRELFVAGERRPRAQHPNAGWARVVEAGPDNRTSFTFKPEEVPAADGALVGEVDMELFFLHDWSTSRVRVKHIDRETNTLTVANPIGCAAPHYRITHFEPHPRYRLEDHRALLDAPGEWHLDEEAGVLTYMPMPGEKREGFTAVAPVATSLLEVRGGEGKPVRGLRFEGLRLEHCAWHTPPGGYAAGQAGFHERRENADGPSGGGGILRELMPAAVTFELAEDCALDRVHVAHVGSSGVWLGSRCHRCTITRSTVTDIAGNGVLVGEDRGRRLANGKAWWQAEPDQAATGNVVSDSRITHCGRLYHGAVAVWVGFTRGTRIEHNQIAHHPYTGVSVGWNWNPQPTPCRDNVVTRNHIHHVMQVLSDGGGIYTLGRQPGGRLSHNVIHDVPLNLGRAESNGMFLDEGTTELVIEHNVIYNLERSPLRFHRAEENLVRNNVLVLEKDTPPVRYNATDPEKITLTDNELVPAGEWSEERAAQAKRGVGPR